LIINTLGYIDETLYKLSRNKKNIYIYVINQNNFIKLKLYIKKTSYNK